MPTIQRFAILLAILSALPAISASADVLVLKNGKTMAGIVEESATETGPYTFIGSYGRQAIPRDRVSEVRKEPLAQGLVHIGDDFRRRNDLTSALIKYREAAVEQPDFDLASERIKATEEALRQRDMSRREGELSKIDAFRDKIQEHIRLQEFEKGEQLLQNADEMVPAAEQVEELQALAAELYLAWAKERLDKFDKRGAEEKLNLALAAGGQNDEVVRLLLSIWENQPDKKEQMLRIYESRLSRSPEDKQLRHTVADLNYDLGNLQESIFHYLELVKTEADRHIYRGTLLEKRIIENLDVLHRQFAQKKEYDKAISFYKILVSMNPAAQAENWDDYYEYLKLSKGVKLDDVEGRLRLAVFAQKVGFLEYALGHYNEVLKADPENQAARTSLDRFAMDYITRANQSLERQDFYLAKSYAGEVRREFPGAKEAVYKADQIIARANIEIERDKTAKREQALLYIQRGDQAFREAKANIQSMYDRNVEGFALVSDPKQDAIRRFDDAIKYYETALKIDPSLQREDISAVSANLNEARAFLKRLRQGPPEIRGLRSSNRPFR